MRERVPMRYNFPEAPKYSAFFSYDYEKEVLAFYRFSKWHYAEYVSLYKIARSRMISENGTTLQELKEIGWGAEEPAPFPSFEEWRNSEGYPIKRWDKLKRLAALYASVISG